VPPLGLEPRLKRF